MPEFILTHRFPNGFKGAPDTAAAARAWFKQIDGRLVSRNDGAVEPRKRGDCGPGTDPNAYTIVSAENLDEAEALAARWPLLERGGGIEVRALTTSAVDTTVRP